MVVLWALVWQLLPLLGVAQVSDILLLFGEVDQIQDAVETGSLGFSTISFMFSASLVVFDSALLLSASSYFWC